MNTLKPNSMKKVCIALDYGGTAKKIAEMGYAFTKNWNAEITLVHVTTNPIIYGVEYSLTNIQMDSLKPWPDQLVLDIKNKAEIFLTELVKNLKDPTVKIKVLNGEVTDALINFIKENDIDLIVLGTHGHTGLKNLLVGSTAVHLIKHLKIPLFIIPEQSK